MSPAEAREALERAFPGMEWRVVPEGRVYLVGQRAGLTVLASTQNGRNVAAVDGVQSPLGRGDTHVEAVRSAIANARAHLVNQIAALDAATEKA